MNECIQIMQHETFKVYVCEKKTSNVYSKWRIHLENIIIDLMSKISHN